MTDPWDATADRIRAARDAANKQTAADAAAQQKETAAAQARAAQRETEIQQLISELVPVFQNFILQRGAAARRLLAQHSSACIVFGAVRSRGHIFFDKDGFGRPGARIQGPSGTGYARLDASAYDAVEFFVRYGPGSASPEAARNIVGWFQRQVEQYNRTS